MFTMSRRRKLILATHNTHKQKEMNALLDSLGVNIIGLDEYPHIGEIEEKGLRLLKTHLSKHGLFTNQRDFHHWQMIPD